MGHVTELDWRTQEFAHDTSEMKAYFLTADRCAYLAQVASRKIGFALVYFDKFNDVVSLDTIGVHREFRKNGVGRKLVDRIGLEAHTEGFRTIQMLVPTYLIEDKEDPWNIEQAVWKWNFKSVGEDKESCARYGRLWDQYIFERTS
jgi:GNAT superfamily N-acetyltransferase